MEPEMIGKMVNIRMYVEDFSCYLIRERNAIVKKLVADRNAGVWHCFVWGLAETRRVLTAYIYLLMVFS